ncbi:sensor histidine kinase [Metabacillus fastidiosus]|uniref:sensor histidine kinase n=1 Tax=Metabacillus fastidiosus TaxID=1458 RepID=UPI003D26FD72
MYLTKWIKGWLIAASICIVIMTGGAAYLFFDGFKNESESPPDYVINQVRLKVSDIMLYLEQYYEHLHDDPKLQHTLQAICEKSGINVAVARLDGEIIFTSSKEQSIQTIDMKNAVHYDLYTSRIDKDQVKIAFPIVDDQTKVQVGNAIFMISSDIVSIKKSHTVNIAVYIIIAFFSIILFVLLFVLRNKIKYHTILPISRLKDYSEAILKGDYEQKAQYKEMDEIGEVYAMFDQMRMEIKHLSKCRDEQENAQKELISNISHDIKTPLTTVKAYIDAIIDGVCPDQESMMDYVKVMQVNTDKMARLVEDLLLHALRELGQVSVNPTEQYSKAVFRRILKPISHLVQTRGVIFIESEDIPDVLINVDEHRLEQVISNLIANALKHTSTGDTISVTVQQEEKDLKVTIADTGMGILPEDMPFIFEHYFKGQTALHHRQRNEGYGLGLSICKYIIESHNGQISFKSLKGSGTVFYFSIPLC